MSLTTNGSNNSSITTIDSFKDYYHSLKTQTNTDTDSNSDTSPHIYTLFGSCKVRRPIPELD